MLRVLFAASLAALLAGCASIPQPKQPPTAQHKAPVVKQAAKPVEARPVEAITPNQTVKKRWQWPHPKWFH